MKQGTIYEQVENGKYGVYSQTVDKTAPGGWRWEYRETDEILAGDHSNKPMKTVPWLLCPDNDGLKPNDYQLMITSLDNELIHAQVKNYIATYWDHPDPRAYDVFATWIMNTWIKETYTIYPYLYFRGPVGSGKTAGLDLIRLLAYRGVMSSSISVSALARIMEAWRITPVIDEAEKYAGIDQAEIRAVINASYRKGQKFIRCQGENQDIYMADTSGNIALASINPQAYTLEDRSIILKMRKTVNPNIERKHNLDAAKSLRAGLLSFRFRTLVELYSVTDKFDYSGVPPLLDRSGRPVLGREAEIFEPLLVTMISPEVTEATRSFALERAGEREGEWSATMYADLGRLILELSGEGLAEAAGSKWIPIQKVVDTFNEGKNKEDMVTSNMIGRVLSTLGFNKRNQRIPSFSKAVKCIEVTDKTLAYLAKTYGPDEKVKMLPVTDVIDSRGVPPLRDRDGGDV